MKFSSKILSLLSVVALSARAQEAGVPPKVFGGNAEATVLATSGNTSTQSYGLASELAYKPSEWFHALKLNYVSTFQSSAKTAESAAAELRSGRDLNERLDVYAAYGFSRNVFSGFSSRNTLEAGLGYKILPLPPHALRLETALAFVDENLVPAGHNDFAAVKVGLLYRWTISESADLSNDITSTFSLKSSADWRLVDQLAITAALDNTFSVKSGVKVEHRNAPVVGRKATDTTTTVALVAKF